MKPRRPSPEDLLTTSLFAPLGYEICQALAPHLELRFLEPGEMLLNEGDEGKEAFVVLGGRLKAELANKDGGATPLSFIGPGETIGEIALIAGTRRTASVTAVTAAKVVPLHTARLNMILKAAPEAKARLLELVERRLAKSRSLRERPGAAAIVQRLGATEFLGSLSPEVLERVEPHTRWLTLSAGETLITEGEPSNAIYVVLSGRLLARSSTRTQTFDVFRGEVLGEIGLLTGAPRTATVLAVRDSELLCLTREGFNELSAAEPAIVTHVLKQGMSRLVAAPKRQSKATMVALLLPPELLASNFAKNLLMAAGKLGSVHSIDAAAVDSALGASVAECEPDDPRSGKVAHWLATMEDRYDVIVLIAPSAANEWTRRAIHFADKVMLGCIEGAGSISRDLFGVRGEFSPPVELLTFHKSGAQPTRSARWFKRLPISRIHHVVWDDEAGVDRIARHLCGKTVGLVLGGGGARGFAHFGVIRAMHENAVPIDWIGGTNTGALVAAMTAMNHPTDAAVVQFRREFLDRHPEKEIGLSKNGPGRATRLPEALQAIFGELDFEDFWIPCFSTATNLTTAKLDVRDTGRAWKWLAAANTLPIVTAPRAEEKSYFCDGSILNNIPADLMRAGGAGTVISVDVGNELALTPDRFSSTDGHDGLATLIRTRGESQPGTFDILFTLLALGDRDAAERAERNSDLVIRPPLAGFGPLEYSSIDHLLRVGQESAREALASWLSRHGRPWSGA